MSDETRGEGPSEKGSNTSSVGGGCGGGDNIRSSSYGSEIATAIATTATTTATTTRSAPTPTITSTSNSSPNNSTSDNSSKSGGLKILFLSSDTGGGHRASAESLGKQFQLLYPGSTYDLADVVASDWKNPYSSQKESYKYLSAHPTQWKMVYGISNTRAFEKISDAHLKLFCERAVRRQLKSYNPDVVVSVHPLMNNVPALSCEKLTLENPQNPLPMYTVVTDLGSAHCMWFENNVQKVFVGSEVVHELAKTRGNVQEDKLVIAGLPIRHDFAIQAEQMGTRMSKEGRHYQQKVRKDLDLPYKDDNHHHHHANNHRKTILVMGGGEGCGALSNIVNALYYELVSQGINANILVVCGRNQKLKSAFDTRNWDHIMERFRAKRDKYSQESMFNNNNKEETMSHAISYNDITDNCLTFTTPKYSTLRRVLSDPGKKIFCGHYNVCMAIPNDVPDCNEEEKTSTTEEKKIKNDSVEVGIGVDADVNSDDYCIGAAASTITCGSNSVIDDSISINNANSFGSKQQEQQYNTTATTTPGKVKVIALGFVTRMAEYMVAADVLVSKAGPGTICEAASLSLPVLLTSFLPGQEEGNVDFVVDGKFGSFCGDNDPIGIAEECCMWLTDENKLRTLSHNAKKAGAPHAARNIAKQIGDDVFQRFRNTNTTTTTNKQTNNEKTSAVDLVEEGNDEEIEAAIRNGKGNEPVTDEEIYLYSAARDIAKRIGRFYKKSKQQIKTGTKAKLYSNTITSNNNSSNDILATARQEVKVCI